MCKLKDAISMTHREREEFTLEKGTSYQYLFPKSPFLQNCHFYVVGQSISAKSQKKLLHFLRH